MNNSFQFLDIILFAMIAAFLILRLRSVLGRHKDSGDSPKNNERDNFSTDLHTGTLKENVVSLPKAPAEKNDVDQETQTENVVERGIKQIQAATNDFVSEEFLTGAKSAFEMIIKAFADGNVDVLDPLLDREVYNNFLQAIRRRESENQTLENNLVRIVDCEIIEASMADNFANVTVKFVSEQINVTRDSKGDVVSGDPDYISVVTDIWTLSRDTGSQDPNWKLIATRSLD